MTLSLVSDLGLWPHLDGMCPSDALKGNKREAIYNTKSHQCTEVFVNIFLFCFVFCQDNQLKFVYIRKQPYNRLMQERLNFIFVCFIIF